MARSVAAAILAAGVLSSLPALAEELSRPGEPVVARVERPEGDRYEITVTPPFDRGVDRRVMGWLTDSGIEDTDAADEEPVDMSGYRVRVERLAGANCSGRYEIRSKPVNLAPKKAWYVESETATWVSGTGFPTKGEVDVYVTIGPNFELCAKSTRKKQNIDHAGCIRTACTTQFFSNIRAQVANPSGAQATAVAVFDLIFVTLP